MKRMGEARSAAAKLIGMPAKEDMTILIDHHYTSKVYTCGSTVSGILKLVPRCDVRFDFVQINLLGSASIHREHIYVTTHRTHLFLRLDMPVPESTYPTPRVYRAGTTYTIPFRFTVPHNLPENSCRHPVESDSIRSRHLQLPSSLRGWDKDDLSPEMTIVKYFVTARALELIGGEGKRIPVVKMEAEHALKLLTASPEDPPMIIAKHNTHFALEETRTLRGNILSSSSGRITARSSQPEAIRLNADGHGARGSSVHIEFIFKPSTAEALPPQVTVNSAKITAHTWGSPQPIRDLPEMGSGVEPFVLSTRVVMDSVSTASWTTHVDPPDRETAGKSHRHDSPVTHKTSMKISFRLPTSTHVFPPTFYSCLLSRTYCLTIGLSAGGRRLRLILPVQVAMEPEAEHTETSPDDELPTWQEACGSIARGGYADAFV
ncbi:arrestin [Colletotrichum tabaci]|uniref:Arrestin n=1 Tax=Colletotrichum tabaci TaxID=1209068 RepID=A0AAV9TJV2_9PEZI